MVQGEVRLEIGPSLVDSRLAFPGFAIVQEYAGCEEELKGGGYDLGGGIGSISGGGILEGVFDLVKEAFNRLIGIVDGPQGGVVFLEVGCGDTSLLGV